MTASLAGTYNILCEQGATLERHITWADSAKNPYNLNGFTAKMQVRTNDLANTLITELSTDNEYIVLANTAVQYNVVINLPASVTSDLATGMYVYDLFITSPSTGKVDKILEGNFKVKARTTR